MELDKPLLIDPRHPRLAIGHNVGYDRVRVKECYDREVSILIIIIACFSGPSVTFYGYNVNERFYVWNGRSPDNYI